MKREKWNRFASRIGRGDYTYPSHLQPSSLPARWWTSYTSTSHHLKSCCIVGKIITSRYSMLTGCSKSISILKTAETFNMIEIVCFALDVQCNRTHSQQYKTDPPLWLQRTFCCRYSWTTCLFVSSFFGSRNGIGRCGIFIAVYNAIAEIKEKEKVNMFAIVSELRNRRPMMVDSLVCFKLVSPFPSRPTTTITGPLSVDTIGVIHSFPNRRFLQWWTVRCHMK